MGGNRLTGRIPTEVGRMSSLESISLYVNQLTGTIPKELANLSRLNVLYLDTNSFQPTLPAEICTELVLEEFWTDCSDIGGCECCTRW